MSIQPGTRVHVTTAGGEKVPMISMSTEVAGKDMRVIWVATVDEYRVSHEAAHRLPWPSQYVQIDNS
jgi:hypothetical protein